MSDTVTFADGGLPSSGRGALYARLLAPIEEYQREALKRMRWLAIDYLDRADARVIPSDRPYRGQEAMADLVDAIDDLAETIGEDDALLESRYDATLDALEAAKEAAEDDAVLACNLCQPGTPEGGQAIEVCESPLLGHLRSFKVMHLHRRDAVDGVISADEARARAAEEFIFGYIGQTAEGFSL